jgi:hypothetical protein
MGRSHANLGEPLRFAFCPPTSGSHYNVQNQAPLRRAFFGPNDSVGPGNWLHNLEHGFVVLAYRGTPDQATLDQIRTAMDTAAGTPGAAACRYPNKVIAVRFDDMDTPFAALAWDRALLMSEWDTAKAIAFAEQWQDSPQAPEPNAC